MISFCDGLLLPSRRSIQATRLSTEGSSPLRKEEAIIARVVPHYPGRKDAMWYY